METIVHGTGLNLTCAASIFTVCETGGRKSETGSAKSADSSACSAFAAA